MVCTAVFRAGTEVRTAALDGDGRCAIPSGVLQTPWVRLMAGVCGRRGEEEVRPTVWADLGTILQRQNHQKYGGRRAKRGRPGIDPVVPIKMALLKHACAV